MTYIDDLNREADQFAAKNPDWVEVQNFVFDFYLDWDETTEIAMIEFIVDDVTVYIETKQFNWIGDRLFTTRKGYEEAVNEVKNEVKNESNTRAWQRAEREATEWCYETYYDYD